MKSKFKHLVVSGCSFTHHTGRVPGHSTWANLLAEWTGMQIHNLAISGVGNDHISKSIILYLEKNKLPVEDTLVIAMWSGINRIDWITDAKNSNFSTEYSFDYQYDNYNELVVGGAWWNAKNPTPLIKTLVDYSKYQSIHSLTLHSWLAMQNLSNYLKVKEYTYCYTSFLNYKKHSFPSPHFADFDAELAKLNLSIDKDSWLPLNDDDYYGDWARKRKYLEDDHFHPRFPEATKGWLNEILIPTLKNKNILYE
jgi:hypothetical protein